MKIKYSYSIVLLMAALCFSAPFSQNAFGEEKEEIRISDLEKGQQVYSISCILCHGSKGQGDGPASIFIGPYSHPRPNDFTRGVFKYRTTESGDLPTLSDLMRTIRYGIPGYMPSFKHLGEDGVRQVALYISDTFIEDELSSLSMETLNNGESNLRVVAPESDSAKTEPKDDRIEVYKGITVILNNIAQNSLTAIAQEKNPEPALNTYQKIITVLNSMVSNLETTRAKGIIQKTRSVPEITSINRYANQDNTAISLEEKRGGKHPVIVAGVVDVKPLKNENPQKSISKSKRIEESSPIFSTLFIGEGSLIRD